jgi:predicted DCC family thiol-disulfide oxidoreductase YuxK
VSERETNGPVVLFDGVCNLCHSAVRFIVRNDPAGRFRFAALDSEAGRSLLAEAGVDAAGGSGGPDSVVLIENGRVYRRSEAALRIAGSLRLPWRLLAPLRRLPRTGRDAAYDFVARRRYRWFGRKESCPLPAPGIRDRFLD